MIASSNSGYCAFPPRMLRRLEIFMALFLTESTIKSLFDNQRQISSSICQTNNFLIGNGTGTLFSLVHV